MSEDRDRDRYYQGEGQFPGDRRGGYQERFPGDPHGIDPDPPTPHYGAFPGERCACLACLGGYAERFPGDPHGIDLHPPQPARPLADQAHPLGEQPTPGPAESALPSGSVAGEVGGILAALGDRPAFLTPVEATLELSRLRREVRELRGRRAGVAGPAGPARTHEWKFEGGSVVVTVETGGDFTYPDGCITTDPGWVHQSFHVLGAEILRLAGRAQAAEAALAEAEASWQGEAGVLKRSYAKFVEQELRVRRRLADAETALAAAEGRADVAEERAADRDAPVMTAEEGLEINAELTAALAALLGEPPPEPCSPGCRTPHLSAKASEAVHEALGRWRELDGMVRECVPGNFVIRQMRELRKALQARDLWRPAGQGEPGGGTAGSAIEAIDRLTTELAEAKAWATEEAGLAAAMQRELDGARASARHNAEGWEAALTRESALLAERDDLALKRLEVCDERDSARHDLSELRHALAIVRGLLNAEQPDGQ